MNINSEDVAIQDYINRKTSELKTTTELYNDNLAQQQQKLDTLLSEKTNKIKQQMDDINEIVNDANNKPNQIKNQEKIIKVKNNLINTRLIMLRNTKRKNSYRKKIIYTTVALILVVVIVMVLAYVYKNKKHHVKDFNKNVALKH